MIEFSFFVYSWIQSATNCFNWLYDKSGEWKKERAVWELKELPFMADLIKRTGIHIAAVYFSE